MKTILVLLCVLLLLLSIGVVSAETGQPIRSNQVIPNESIFGKGTKFNMGESGATTAAFLKAGEIDGSKFPYFMEIQFSEPKFAAFVLYYYKTENAAKVRFEMGREFHEKQDITVVEERVKQGGFEYYFSKITFREDRWSINALMGNIVFFVRDPGSNGDKAWLLNSALAYKNFVMSQVKPSSAKTSSVRVWTSATDTKIEGSIQKYDAKIGTVDFLRKDGKTFKGMPLQRLSEADQEFIRKEFSSSSN